jgi:primosomal protein N' (replication factor Y)
MFADVVIPRTRLDALTYIVPDALCSEVQVGSAVSVELRRRPVPGIVIALNPTSSVPGPKPILELVEPAYCPADLLQLLDWVSRYYVASWGETLSLALPAKTMGYKPRKPWEMPPASVPPGNPPTLTLDQLRAVRSVMEPIRAHKFKPFLLFGVTGSGKTEIYLRAADEALRLGKSVIILVPEIALTHLLISRFEERFPGRLLALHSGLRDAERRKGWQALRDGRIRLVVGARSAVFAPVPELGLIVVDEEHDQSYKEHERQPHYNARDVAVMRAKLAGATALLASATPSIESFYNTRRGAYALLELPRRIADRPLPKAAIISRRGRESRDQVFSAPLVRAIKERMGTEEQVILFVSRRGFSSQLTCRDCGYAPTCRYCGIPLVYHADLRNLQCHFCRVQEPAPDACPHCKGTDLVFPGVGTQQVVEQLRRLVPGARVLRLDRDVTEDPLAHKRVLDAFGKGEAKFLVGTQMVTKGFDFPNVTLCAAVSADAGLNLPDFRSAERTFQVLTQVAGRAGRGDVPGRALFQTLHPDHHALNFAARQDYRGFYEQEIRFREDLGYPPFTRLALVRIVSHDPRACEQAGELIRSSFASIEGIQVMGPIPAFRKKKRNQCIYLLLVKAKPGSSLSRIFKSSIDIRQASFRKVRIDLDIDPLEIL